MLTNKITGFSADLLNTVRGILGEEKKCPADCECEKCESEEDDEDEDEKEMKEGSMPTADEPTDANKKTAQKIRDMMAKEKKPVKEESDLEEKRGLWDNIHAKRKRIKGGSGEKMRKPGSKGAPTNADFKASANEEAEHANCGTPECCGQCDTAEQIAEVSKATLGRYINKAKDSIDMASYRQGHKEAHGSSSKPLEKKLTKRHKGISTAVGKLTKEDAEQIDEISSDMAHRYLKGKRERDYDISADGKSSKLKKPQSFGKMNKDMKSTARALRTIEKAKKTNEDVEQIDELSKGTMGRYINKAATKMGSQGVTAGLKIAADEKSSKNFKDMGKREKGIKLAVSKLTKEEQDFIDSLNDVDIEQIDELSKDAMLKYLSANKKDDTKARETGDYDKMTKRMRGTDMAVRKYTAKPGSKSVRVPATEEVELDEARGRPKKAGAKDFTIHPKTKEKLMHNNPEHMAKIERLQKNKVLDKPKVEAGQHIMNQLSKAKTSMLGGSTIHFTHGDSKHVSGVHAAKLLSKYAGMKPSEKEDFQKKIGHSHEQLMKHV